MTKQSEGEHAAKEAPDRHQHDHDNHDNHDNHGHDNEKRDIEVIVNGTSFGTMSFDVAITIRELLSEALTETKNTGQPPENWEIKDPGGNLLDLDKHLSDYPNVSQVWLTLKVGVGGETNGNAGRPARLATQACP